MNEDFLHYIWRFQLLDHAFLRTAADAIVQILHPGIHNTDAGPDFFNAKVRIGDTVWVGNVEIHLRSSDWNRHAHSSDEAYNNVILHVVYEDDMMIYAKNERLLPTIEIGQRISSNLQGSYARLLQSAAWVPCASSFSSVAKDKFYMDNFLERVLISRLEEKCSHIFTMLEFSKNNWEEVFNWSLARSFGFKTNSEPFEMLARSIPLRIVHKHRGSRFQIEALLYGQTGLLKADFQDEYPRQLLQEYRLLRRKYNLQPLACHLWKFLRLRPSNFPTLRISQFAQLLCNSHNLFDMIKENDVLLEQGNLFMLEASEYWHSHYTFERKVRTSSRKVMGASSADSILINAVAPFLFVYGQRNELQSFKDKSLDLLANIQPENNAVIRGWNELGYKATSAFYSQALLQLKSKYCQKKKCLSCGVGNRILKNC